mmetsp:Transcript_28055/g.65170  ORF Transcript_28055/g.65170 Transcript_28055/m.65170 type:complete len:466 (-) Transcript_28055:156-1553(-)
MSGEPDTYALACAISAAAAVVDGRPTRTDLDDDDDMKFSAAARQTFSAGGDLAEPQAPTLASASDCPPAEMLTSSLFWSVAPRVAAVAAKHSRCCEEASATAVNSSWQPPPPQQQQPEEEEQSAPASAPAGSLPAQQEEERTEPAPAANQQAEEESAPAASQQEEQPEPAPAPAASQQQFEPAPAAAVSLPAQHVSSTEQPAEDRWPTSGMSSIATRSTSLTPAPPPATQKQRERHVASYFSSVVNSRTWERCDLELGEIPVVKAAADTLQVTPMVVAVATGASAMGFLLYGFGGQFLCTLFGVAYPAFESFKALEAFANIQEPSSTDMYSKATSMQFWLTYWVVVAMLASFEYLFWIALIQIPFYFPMKLLFLLFLFSPMTRGSNTVYNWLVSPILRRNRHRIDTALEESNRKFSESAKRLQHRLSGVALDRLESAPTGVQRVLLNAAGSAVLRQRSTSYGDYD